MSPFYHQVINEEIRDLVGGGGSESAGGVLGPKDVGGLPLRENLQGEVTVAGLSQHEVGTTHARTVMGNCSISAVRMTPRIAKFLRERGNESVYY